MCIYIYIYMDVCVYIYIYGRVRIYIYIEITHDNTFGHEYLYMYIVKDRLALRGIANP